MMSPESKRLLATAYAESHYTHDLAKVMSADETITPARARLLLEHCRRLNCVANEINNIAVGTPAPKLAP